MGTNNTPDAFELIDSLLGGGFDPFWRWEQIQLHVKAALRQQVAGLKAGGTRRDQLRWMQITEVTDPDFVPNIGRLAADIDEVSGRATDASIFAMIQLGRTGCPINHSMRTAFVATLIGRSLGMTDAERKVLGSAALTMNIAMLDLQETLHRQDTPLTDAQREAIKAHPAKGKEQLESFGVRNPDWLRAVLEHHEVAGGKGYPSALEKVFPLAEIIQYCDTYCAMTRPRAKRKALHSNKAAYKLFLGAKGGARIPALILKQLGIYPPGSMVKLANGEIAIVVNRSDNPKAPMVYALCDRIGLGYPSPIQRDTSISEFGVTDVVSTDDVKLEVKPAKLFGYDNK